MPEYSSRIDAVIYGACKGWDADDLFELAVAALDQWVDPQDHKALAVIKQVEALKDGGEDEDICGLCGEPGADKMPHPEHWPGEEVADTELVHAECEQAECARAHTALTQQQREDFLRTI